MKRTVKFLFLLTLSIGFFSSAPAELEFETHSSKIAVIKFTTTVIDYGIIKQNSDGMRLFTFTNEGNAPLVITQVKTSCGCTVPNYSKAPILPGESGEIQIKYDTKRLGNFTKTVTVISNAEGGNKILKIKGKIVTP
ncbi:MAG: DUF1573 domain-containing protein [Winogradskyella sp.]|uniref:DUF1573 domain-containing protein n=1 Tax=Winogradskyella sp. TaxID=1883156 RepID=UPI000F3FA44F|nr:DUF1573 domain-containing protein [Winogradskyella sp.]RNC88449.1 MAG: DUF1573 domain-containing protein [Winogradskyella sp.]